jgi:hypothetical protein
MMPPNENDPPTCQKIISIIANDENDSLAENVDTFYTFFLDIIGIFFHFSQTENVLTTQLKGFKCCIETSSNIYYNIQEEGI